MNQTIIGRLDEPSRGTGWLGQVSGWALVLWSVAVLASVVGVAMAVYAARSGVPLAPGSLRLVTLFLWAALLPVPGLAWAHFQGQCEVWRARVSPQRPLRQVKRVWWRTLGCTALVAILPLWLMAWLGLPPDGSAGFSLYSLSLMLALLSLLTVSAAAWRGMLAEVWVVPGWFVLAFFVLMPEDGWARWAAAEGWRAGVLGLLLTTPALAWGLLRRALRDDLSSRAVGSRPPRRPSLRDRWQRWQEDGAGRLRALDGGAAGALGAIWGQLPLQIVRQQEEGLLFMLWQSTMTISAVVRLLAFTCFALVMLRGPALHWRHLLAPGAVLRSRLGWQVALSTWLLQIAVLLAIVVATWLVMFWLEPGRALSWAQGAALAARYLPVWLLELAFATALATLLRGAAGSLLRAGAALAGLVIVCVAVYLGHYLQTGSTTLTIGVRGPEYVAVLAALTLVTLLAAQRVWARADLGALLRSSRAKPGEGEA